MKRIIRLSLILIIMISMIFCIIKSSYAHLSSNVTIASVSEVQKGEEFTVNFNLSNLQSDKGINALMGTIKYDKYSLTLVKIEGQNGWASPSYNEENGKFVTERNEYVTTDGAFMKVTFKVKDESKQNVNISIEKISVANQDEEIEVRSTSRSITVKGVSQTPNTNTNTSTNINSSSNINNATNSNIRPINSNVSVANTNSIKNETLPNTGSTNIAPIIVIGVCTVMISVFIIRLKDIQNRF